MTPDERIQPGASIELSSQLEFVDLPCIEGHLVTMKTALRHPSLDGPLAFLGGWEIAPLLKRLGCGLTSVQVAQSWSNQISVKSALALIAWLIGRGILVQSPPLPQMKVGPWTNSRGSSYSGAYSCGHEANAKLVR